MVLAGTAAEFAEKHGRPIGLAKKACRLVACKEGDMRTIGYCHGFARNALAGILTTLVAAAMILPTRALAEERKGQGSAWYEVSHADGYELASPEQIRAAYYLFATDGQDWWSGSYHAPSEDYVTAMIGKPGFTASVIAWKTANIVFDPSEVARYLSEFDPTDGEAPDPLGEKDYYEALLFDILYEQSYSVKLLDSLNASLKENKVNLLHTTYKQYRTNFGFDYQLGNGLTYDEGAMVDQCLWDQIVNEGLYGYEAQFKKYLDEVNTMEGKVERVSNLLAMQDVADSQIRVLEELRDRCEGDASLLSLKAACDELLLVYDQESFGAKYFIASQMFPITIKDGLKALYSKVWTGLTNVLGGPWKTLSGAVTLGKTFADMWLSTDAQIEKYFQMSCLMSIRQVLSPMCSEARLGYLSAPTQENAESYLAIMDMLMGVYELELKQSKDYVSILDNALIDQVLEHYDAYESHSALIAGFDSERTKMQREYEFSKEASTAIAVQTADSFENVYGDNALVIASQQEFDWYCQLYADLKAVNEEWVTRLPVKCNADITIDGLEWEIGPAEFKKLTIDNGARLYIIGDVKASQLNIDHQSNLKTCGGVVCGFVNNVSLSLSGGSTLDVAGALSSSGAIVLSSSVLTCGSLSRSGGGADLRLSGGSGVDVSGDAKVWLAQMGEGCALRVGGNLSLDASQGQSAGTVEVGGDLTVASDGNYYGEKSHLLVLCGAADQAVTGGRYSFSAPVVLRNPAATLDVPDANLTLAEDGSCASLSCKSLDLEGHSLEVAGDVKAPRCSLPAGSSLSCAALTPPCRAPGCRAGSCASAGRRAWTPRATRGLACSPRRPAPCCGSGEPSPSGAMPGPRSETSRARSRRSVTSPSRATAASRVGAAASSCCAATARRRWRAAAASRHTRGRLTPACPRGSR